MRGIATYRNIRGDIRVPTRINAILRAVSQHTAEIRAD